jgi:hypothetical protein
MLYEILAFQVIEAVNNEIRHNLVRHGDVAGDTRN